MSLIAWLLWALMVAGALPRAGHHWIEGRLPLWDARWASLASAVLELLLGVALFRSGLLALGLENAPPAAGVVRMLVAGAFAIEGFVRLAGVVATGSSVASLPVLLVWSVVALVLRGLGTGSGARPAA